MKAYHNNIPYIPVASSESYGLGFRVVIDGIVYDHQRHGGINTYFNEILPRLARRSDISIAVVLPNSCEANLPKMAAKIWREPLPAATGLSWKLDQMAKPLLRRANELVTKLRLQFDSHRSWPYIFQSTYFRLSSEAVPQIGLALDMNHEIFPELYQDDWGRWVRRQYRPYLQHATRIIAISQNTKNDVMRFYGIPSEKIDVVHLAVNRETFRPHQSDQLLEARRALTGSVPYILYVGSRHGYKNFDNLLAGFAQTSKDLYLVVAGKEWRDFEIEQINRLGLGSRILSVVHPSDKLLATLYNGALAFIYPSLSEGFGIPLLEAMACETMVLASDIPVFREVAGNAAVYFNPLQVDDIARVLEIPDSTRAQYISRGRQQVANYSWETCAEQTYCVYRKALEC